MKKLMIVLVAITAVISSVQAAFGDKETYVIKIGTTVRIFKVKDVTKESYSWKEFEIINDNRSNISAGELQFLEVPEGAWKLCSSSESGVYSTKEAKLADENKELKDNNEDLLAENQDLNSDKTLLKGIGVGLIILSFFLLLLFADAKVKLKKERAK